MKGNKQMNRNSKIVKKHYAWREAERKRLREEKEKASNKSE